MEKHETVETYLEFEKDYENIKEESKLTVEELKEYKITNFNLKAKNQDYKNEIELKIKKIDSLEKRIQLVESGNLIMNERQVLDEKKESEYQDRISELEKQLIHQNNKT